LIVSVDQIETPNPAALTMAGVRAALQRSVAEPLVEITGPLVIEMALLAAPIRVGVVALCNCGMYEDEPEPVSDISIRTVTPRIVASNGIVNP